MLRQDLNDSALENSTYQKSSLDTNVDRAGIAPSVVEVLGQPTEQATGLPGDAYTSQSFYELEQETIFKRTWVCAGLATDIPNPGDLFPITIAGNPIVLARGFDNEIRAFHNICSHRGVQLVEDPCQKQARITCPYHAWSYELDGKLIHTPHFAGYGKHRLESFDYAANGLKPVRCDRWIDLIFVNLSGDAPPLAEYIDAIIERWSIYDLSLLRYGGEVSFDLNTNWKLAVENFSESYHLPWVHPYLNTLSKMEDHYVFSVGKNHFGQGTYSYESLCLDNKTLPQFPNLPPEKLSVGEFPVLFPNVMLAVRRDFFYVIVVHPTSPGTCTERMAFYFVGDEAMSSEFEKHRTQIIERHRAINVEDINIVERLFKGRSSSAFDGGKFSPALETTVHRFQQLVAKWLDVNKE